MSGLWDTFYKAAYPSDRPSETMFVANSCKTVGAAVKAAAVYNGADQGNYKTESIIVTITRSACDHVAGEILYTGTGEHAPDCENPGLGHRECTKCHEVTESCIVVAALGHQGGTATCYDNPKTESLPIYSILAGFLSMEE